MKRAWQWSPFLVARRCQLEAVYRRASGWAGAKLELQVRDADGRWVLSEASAGQELELEALGVRLAVDDVYREPPSE